MEGNKLELSEKPSADPPATYKAIPEADMEEDAVTRPKSLVKPNAASPEADGADEKMLPKEEVADAKISPNEKQNGDAKLDIGDLKTAFVGLTKEELMKYANDPFWVRLRWFLFITFWILWGLMLLGAVMIILAAPKCNPPPPRTWWEKGPLVELKDDASEETIKKVKELGVTGVIISWPENAYSEFSEDHELIKSFKQFKEKEINVVVELEPSASPLVWFNKSESRDPLFSEFYIWRQPKEASNGGEPTPPNNWLSVRNVSSWKYSPNRKEFYYAPMDKPHLNFYNPRVVEKFSEVIKKFLNYGAGGIRLKGAPYLLVDPNFEDEPIKIPNPTGDGFKEHSFYTHPKTKNVMQLGPLLKQWRFIVKNMTENGPFMVAEHLSNIEAYKVNSSFVVDLPLQSHLLNKPSVNITDVVHVLNTTFNADNITWPLWKVNASSEWDLVTYLLPGTPLVMLESENNKELLKIRNSPSIMRGSFSSHLLNNKTVFAFTRVTAGNPGILVALNPSDNRTVVDFPAHIKGLSEDVTVQLFSANYSEPNVAVSVKHDAHSVPISPKSAIVMSYVPPSK
ncbi:amino acid transporter heavy chain SLC3A1 [Tribolium castaneum]|uniref:alpha-glucosidase n=1 Tax=Tribolium castaneum TaxID=7070 RepID=D6WPZ5_TRICA|nr:PREDICTED: neutral and basic amino acid transport protein rBAT isoform X2 [Tribolium castaneum]EFA06898.1 Neutral and basic amino acid transport protein rBAT-like Protein [Tribolium castaneum]|eukprot:XP_973672.1 PREDICTED: neutral and basic amino acid transport protein rBAT isoform X2 [Tribolium castaneum]